MKASSLIVPLLAASLAGCGSLLPRAHQEDGMPWHSYAQAEQLFARIQPNQSRKADLDGMGINPATLANITLLNHADLARRLAAISAVDFRLLPEPLQHCLAAHARCSAYEIEQKHLERQRYGSFWADFLNFERKVHVRGWQFNALIILQDDLVVYKLWSGKPKIEQEEQENSPLGPLQGLGTSLLRP